MIHVRTYPKILRKIHGYQKAINLLFESQQLIAGSIYRVFLKVVYNKSLMLQHVFRPADPIGLPVSIWHKMGHDNTE